MAKKITHPIDLVENRYGLFMSDDSFDLDIMYGREYLNSDINHKVKLYRIDLLKTKSHDLYGQSKPSEKVYKDSVELSVMINIEDSEQKNYGDTPGGIVRDDTGNLVFGVYLKELEDKDVDISRGDIIEYNMSGYKNRYYEVESANNVTDTTAKTIAGFKSYWRRVTATPVKTDAVNLGGDQNR